MEKSKISYLNTDLEIKSNQPFDLLRRFFHTKGMFELRYDVAKVKRISTWTAWFEVERDYKTPEKTIQSFIKILNGLGPAERKEWDKAKTKIFNIGYECGEEPWAFCNELSKDLLHEISKYGAGITITIYPERYSLGRGPVSET